MTAAFHVRIFDELIEEDALAVVAKGLGIQSIVGAFVRAHCSTDSLVLHLNAAPDSQRLLVEQMLASSVSLLPTIVTNLFSPAERSELYMRGGVLCITPRLLVVDMLSGRVPIERVSGLLIENAHEVTDSSNLAFIVRLYRQRNANGFLKAFSDDPLALVRGMCRAEKVLKLLRIRRLALWPRFQADIRSELEDPDAAPQVVEYKLPLSERAQTVQDGLVECVDACLSELRRMHRSLDLPAALGTGRPRGGSGNGAAAAAGGRGAGAGAGTGGAGNGGGGGGGSSGDGEGSGELIEHALFRSFDVVVRMQLDSVWHQCSRKTKQLVADLSTLRKLLRHLCTYDSVTYYELLLALSALELPHAPAHHRPLWLQMDCAAHVQAEARARVYSYTELTETGRPGADGDDATPASAQAALAARGGHAPGAQGSSAGGCAAAAGGASSTAGVAAAGSAAGAAATSAAAATAAAAAARPAIVRGVVTPLLEPNPKWALLRSILNELRAADEKTAADLQRGKAAAAGAAGAAGAVDEAGAPPPPVLVIAREGCTVSQLRDVLRDGDRPFLRKRFFAHAWARHARSGSGKRGAGIRTRRAREADALWLAALAWRADAPAAGDGAGGAADAAAGGGGEAEAWAAYAAQVSAAARPCPAQLDLAEEVARLEGGRAGGALSGAARWKRAADPSNAGRGGRGGGGRGAAARGKGGGRGGRGRGARDGSAGGGASGGGGRAADGKGKRKAGGDGVDGEACEGAAGSHAAGARRGDGGESGGAGCASGGGGCGETYGGGGNSLPEGMALPSSKRSRAVAADRSAASAAVAGVGALGSAAASAFLSAAAAQAAGAHGGGSVSGSNGCCAAAGSSAQPTPPPSSALLAPPPPAPPQQQPAAPHPARGRAPSGEAAAAQEAANAVAEVTGAEGGGSISAAQPPKQRAQEWPARGRLGAEGDRGGMAAVRECVDLTAGIVDLTGDGVEEEEAEEEDAGQAELRRAPAQPAQPAQQQLALAAGAPPALAGPSAQPPQPALAGQAAAPPAPPEPPSFTLRGLVACADGSAPLIICDSEQAAALLIECRPQHIVLFEPELRTIREIEVYAACRALAAYDEAEAEAEAEAKASAQAEAGEAEDRGGDGAARGASADGADTRADAPASPQRDGVPLSPSLPPPVSVHMCVFDGSVEEQRYLTSVRTEREAFRRLIEERGSMVLPDFEHDVEPDLADDHARAAANGGVYRARPRVIVDVREFRSSLPFQLHRAGVELVPATLEVGDYVLSPQVCVERKALPDLIESFKSGRLHHQVETMCRHYKEPVLLIELDSGRPFLLQHPSELSGDIAPSALSSKLCLLLLHFPQLRLIWAHGSASTVAHFLGLKAKRDQPETDAAVAAGQETEAVGADGSAGFSLVAQDMLRRMPGVNAHNVHKLMRKAGSLQGLARMSQAELAGCIGAQCAKQLAAFLDTAPTEEV